MSQQLLISICNYLIPELSQVINRGDYPDVKLSSFPASCSKNSINTEQTTLILSTPKSKISENIIIGSFCLPKKKINIENKNVQTVHLDQCFELFVNRETVEHFITNGYYIVTNGWLRTYEKNIEKWGFDEKTAKLFFQESMKGIMLLDTQIPGDYMPNLKSLSEYMGLPYEILPVGLSFCESFIDKWISNWRQKETQKDVKSNLSKVSRQSADYQVIFNQLGNLVNITDEIKIIEIGFELLNLLFAPSNIIFTRVLDHSREEHTFKGIHANQNPGEEEKFKIEVFYAEQLLGIFDILGIQFPQFIEEYKKTGEIINQIFGLSIVNARKYKIILEQREQLTSYSMELQELNRSKDKFFSIISHDLKSPFNSLVGISELLMKEVQNGDPVKIETYSKIINETSNHAFTLLMNLLEWAQSQTGRIEYEPRYFNLLELIDGLDSLLEAQAEEKDITIYKKIPPEFQLFGDENMIKTVIRNIVSNAIKFTHKYGMVTFSAIVSEDHVVLSVKDTGIGITEEGIAKLFQIEHSTGTLGTNDERGTGLGLILCKEFIEKHNGKLWVESEVGKGSTFYFSIPVVKA